jgi:tetratricopeptide (TPR) repeat protein
MKKNRLLMTFLVLSICSLSFAQSSGSEVLTNDKVIAMMKAGLPPSIIVNKIHASKTNFDTSTDELIRLKNAQVPDEIIGVMLGASGPSREAESQPASFASRMMPSDVSRAYPDEIGLYLKIGEQWTDLLPEIVNWKTGGVMKSIATRGLVKGDVNGHIDGKQSRTSVSLPAQFLVVVPEGVAITEYQLLRLHQNSNNREFRTITGGVFHAEGSSSRDMVSFEGHKIARRTFLVELGGLNDGEYGFLPPGSSSSKMFTFSIVAGQWSTPVSSYSSLRTDNNTKGSYSAPQSSAPNNADGFNQAGLRLFSQQQLAEAEGTFREAIRLDPQNALYHHNLATALNAQQKYKEAEKEAALAVRLAPNEETYQRDLELIRANRRQ